MVGLRASGQGASAGRARQVEATHAASSVRCSINRFMRPELCCTCAADLGGRQHAYACHTRQHLKDDMRVLRACCRVHQLSQQLRYKGQARRGTAVGVQKGSLAGRFNVQEGCAAQGGSAPAARKAAETHTFFFSCCARHHQFAAPKQQSRQAACPPAEARGCWHPLPDPPPHST